MVQDFRDVSPWLPGTRDSRSVGTWKIMVGARDAHLVANRKQRKQEHVLRLTFSFHFCSIWAPTLLDSATHMQGRSCF